MTVFSNNVTTANSENRCGVFSCIVFTGLCSKFHIQGCSGSLFLSIRLKGKDNFHAVTVLLF